MNYIVDTNIITAIMKNDEKLKKKLLDIAFRGKEVFINGISYYEIKRGLLSANATRKLTIFDSVCKKFRILLLDEQGIFDKASEIYAALKQRGELIEDADILIAAMTLTKNFILISNDNHFKKIKDINLENWLN